MTPRAAPPPQFTVRRVAMATLVGVLVLLAFWLLYRFHMVVFTLFVALVLGTAIKPIVEWLSQRGVSRALSVILVYLLLLALLAGLAVAALPTLLQQVATIRDRLPGYYNSLHTEMRSSPSQLVRRMSEELPFTPPVLEEPQQPTEDEAALAVTRLLGYAELAGEAIFLLILVLLMGFYWTLEGERTIRGLLMFTPLESRDTLRTLVDAIEAKLGAFVRGQAFLCLSVGVLALIAYLILGLPYALLLAIIAGLMEAVPIVGPVLGAVPALLIAAAADPSKVPWVIGATVIIQQLENNLLVPRVMDRSVGVNPIVSLLALAAFGSLLGLVGALMAIPLAAVIQVLLNRYLLEPDTQGQQQPAGRDRASSLRYEVQQISQDLRKLVRHKPENVAMGSDQIEDVLEVIANDLDRMLAETEIAKSGQGRRATDRKGAQNRRARDQEKRGQP